MTHGHFCGCLRFPFVELKKPANDIFYRNLHLLNFPTMYSLACFPLKGRAYEFFPGGHLRRSGVTRLSDSLWVQKTVLGNNGLLGTRNGPL